MEAESHQETHEHCPPKNRQSSAGQLRKARIRFSLTLVPHLHGPEQADQWHEHELCTEREHVEVDDKLDQDGRPQCSPEQRAGVVGIRSCFRRVASQDEPRTEEPVDGLLGGRCLPNTEFVCHHQEGRTVERCSPEQEDERPLDREPDDIAEVAEHAGNLVDHEREHDYGPDESGVFAAVQKGRRHR